MKCAMKDYTASEAVPIYSKGLESLHKQYEIDEQADTDARLQEPGAGLDKAHRAWYKDGKPYKQYYALITGIAECTGYWLYGAEQQENLKPKPTKMKPWKTATEAAFDHNWNYFLRKYQRPPRAPADPYSREGYETSLKSDFENEFRRLFTPKDEFNICEEWGRTPKEMFEDHISGKQINKGARYVVHGEYETVDTIPCVDILKRPLHKGTNLQTCLKNVMGAYGNEGLQNAFNLKNCQWST
jgi:hypothetical protein